MTRVGRKNNRKPNTKLLAAIQLTSLATAFLAAFYSIFTHLSNAHSPSPFYKDGAMFVSTILFVLLAIGQAIFTPKARKSLALCVILNYLFSSFYAVFVIGDKPAVYIFGIILIVVTESILGLKAMMLGLAYFATVMICFGALSDDGTGGELISTTISITMMAGVAAILIWLKRSNLVRIELYESLKVREELQSKRLETVINTLNDAVLDVDAKDGIVHLYNAAAMNLLDTNKDIIGLKIDKLFKLTDEGGTSMSFTKLIQNSSKVVERSDLIHTYTNGQKINLYISISPIRDAFKDDIFSDMKNVIIIVRDITKQKSFDDERDEFVSVVSHELRTPVAIAEGALSNIQFLLEKGGNIELLKKTLRGAHQQILFLSQMINDLSTLSRAQRGINMKPEKIDIETFLDGLRTKYTGDARKQHLKLELDSRVIGKICTPLMAIEEVMQNLITNAIKYTKEGVVTIGTRRVDSNTDGPEVEFFIRDTGIGISKSDQAHLFQRFWRSEDYRTRETSGTGLGLHVVSQLAAKMNTRVEMRSRLNHGSTFSFRLPLVQDTTKNQISDKSDH
ncbi:PAS domain-containing sensor histidine kinase [Candidatus Saccharibacteria bacterium]|nr:PAS domain-containing sensor histidine kinase [Candidatus Saccharibacteria bacterium]